MKRATLLLDDEIYRRAKELAAERGLTLKQVINDLLVRGLNKPNERQTRHFALPIHRKVKPIQGVDIADRDVLFDLLEDS